MPSNSGEQQWIEFDLTDFVKIFKLNIHTAMYSLKMLEQEGNEIRAIPAPKGPKGEPVGRKFCDRMNAFAQKEGLPGMGYIFWRKKTTAFADVTNVLEDYPGFLDALGTAMGR